MTDPELLSVRSELALIDSHLHDLLDQLTTGESRERMLIINETVHKMDNILSSPKPSLSSLKALVRQARGLLNLSFGEDSVWAKINDTIGSRIRLTDSERKLDEMKQASVASDRLQVLMMQLLASVRQHVVDLPGGPDAVNGVATDLLNMLGMAPEKSEADGDLN